MLSTFNGSRFDEKWLERISKLPDYPNECCSIAPNVAGFLHLGHAFTGVIQDCIARFENLNGKNVSWIHGFDHAGIDTLAQGKNQLFAQVNHL